MSFSSEHTLVDPPREVPWRLKFQLVFGFPFASVLWMWLGLASAAVWAGGVPAVQAWHQARGATVQVQGECVEVDRSNELRDPIDTYRWRFVRDGVTHTGESYGAPGRARAGPCRIEVPIAAPQLAWMEGLSRTDRFHTFMPWLVFGHLLIVILTLLRGFSQSRRRVRLFRDGRLTSATLTKRQDLATKALLAFDYEVDGRTYTHGVIAAKFELGSITDEPRERLLYDPSDPQQSQLLDLTGAEGHVTAEGELEASISPSAVTTVAIAALIAGANGLFLVRLLL